MEAAMNLVVLSPDLAVNPDDVSVVLRSGGQTVVCQRSSAKAQHSTGAKFEDVVRALRGDQSDIYLDIVRVLTPFFPLGSRDIERDALVSTVARLAAEAMASKSQRICRWCRHAMTVNDNKSCGGCAVHKSCPCDQNNESCEAAP
jgi:hypothetical protein